MKLAIIASLFAAATHMAAAENIILSGLVRNSESISPRVLNFITEMNCLHFVKVHIVGDSNIAELQVKYDKLVGNLYEYATCASLDLVEQPANLSHVSGRIARLQELREFQKADIMSRLVSTEDLDSTAVIVVDLDLSEMPQVEKVMKHAKSIINGFTNVDALCAAGVSESDTEFYYDTFATVLLPETFIYPVKDREVKKAWPSEDTNFIVHEGSFGGHSMMKWLKEQGRSETAEMMFVPVRSCFGGMAIYRGNKFFDQRCSYSHGKNFVANVKYHSAQDRAACEHVLWSNCMTSFDSNFLTAIQPDMKTIYHNPRENAFEAENNILDSVGVEALG